MKLKTQYHQNPHMLHLGTEPVRAYYLPFSSQSDDCTLSLNASDWSFQWYDCLEDVPEHFPTAQWQGKDTIPVPSCVQCMGYDHHQYANAKMPIPFDPPYVPHQNPCGGYGKTFSLAYEPSQRYYLNFDGVDSCFYLWVNGHFVGYSQVSHANSEFEIGNYLQNGSNFLRVLVFKWCDGTYFEDQDKLRLTGIFRDVYLLNRPALHLQDFTVTSSIHPASITVSLVAPAALGAVQYTLYAPDGQQICSERTTQRQFTIAVKHPLLWNAEMPYLYQLTLCAGGETIVQQVGLRSVRCQRDVLRFNDQIFKCKGVNRHDSDPVTGYTISREQLIQDLQLMKAHNINAIRTSHYPNAPWAYALYNQFGFYVIDEADLETHNTRYLYGGDCPHYNYQDEILSANTMGLLCSDSTYQKAVLDRVQRCVIRDKNQPCVILFSLGNEAGYGQNMEDAAHWVKANYPQFLLHYEGSIYQMEDHQNDVRNIDVYSRMYMPPEDIEAYCNKTQKRPLVLCEYSSAMGNSSGDLEAYYQQLYRHDAFFGAFVWEWCDHAVYDGTTKEGKERYLYGGDFGEFPVENNFCVDGLVFPNRTPHTGLLEHRNVARPIRTFLQGGSLCVWNTNDFTNLKDTYVIHWQYRVEHSVIAQGTFPPMDVPAHQRKRFPLPAAVQSVPAHDNQETSLLLRYETKQDSALLRAATPVGFDQIVFCRAQYQIPAQPAPPPAITQQERYLTITQQAAQFCFDTWSGAITQWCHAGENLMQKPMEYNLWRAPTDNDRKIKYIWQDAGYDRTTVRVYHTEVCPTAQGIDVRFSLGIGAVFLQNILRVETCYRLFADGRLALTVSAQKDKVFPYLPRFGIRLFLPVQFEQVRYVGFGPHESYLDKHHASYEGDFSTNVHALHEDYIKPQENGSHCGCRKLTIASPLHALMVVGDGFSFHASHYTQENLTKTRHHFELVADDCTELCLDGQMSGIGSASCGPALPEQYQVCADTLSLHLTMKVDTPM